MKRSLVFTFTVLSAVLCLIAPAPSGTDRAGQDSNFPGEMLMPLDCEPIDPALIDPSLPAPVAHELPEYTKDLVLRWGHVTSDSVHMYYVQASPMESFDPIEVCILVPLADTAYSIISLTDTVWCRVYSVDTARIMFSPPSNKVHTIVDITSPDLLSISLQDPATHDTSWTSSRRVDVAYFGSESFDCDSIILSEDHAFRDFRAIDIDSCSGMVEFGLSAGYGRKVVYGMLVDRVGNRSDPVSASIVYGVGSHSYPNPFNPRFEQTNLVFGLARPGPVPVYIYDLFGNLVLRKTIMGIRGLNDGASNPEARWDGRNSKGELVADGGYVCVIIGDEKYVHKIAVVK